MATNDYHFVTHWRVRGTVEDVTEILRYGRDLPRWWPAVYLSAQEVEPGDADGIGTQVDLYTKGWLPYTIRWRAISVEAHHPHGFSLETSGDFVGAGEWNFAQDGDWVDVTYDWRVRADKPLLRYGAFLFRPLFAFNHRWAMSTGEESLRLELARRRAATPAERAQVPAPPGPTPAFSPSWLLPVAALLVGGAGLRYLRRR
jgi:hypothetical protein